MKYLDSFLGKNSANIRDEVPLEPPKPPGDSEGANLRNSGDSCFYVPLEPPKPRIDGQESSFSGSGGGKDQECPEISVVRRIVAGWPISLRERWGRRANELADRGVPHPDDERQAFSEIEETP